MKKNTPVLYLIPSTLGDTLPHKVIPQGTLDVIHRLEHFIVEEERTARRFLLKAGIRKPVDTLTFYILNEHTGNAGMESFLLRSGEKDLGLLSEAGAPAVADPGTELVRMAHHMGYKVIPLAGPSSILLALMASGLNGQHFAFSGYLPVKTHERNARIRQLEKKSQSDREAQIFIEAPYRNNQLMKSVIDTCSDDTWLCVASNLTLENEWICTQTIARWKSGIPDLNKQPAVFILQKM